MMTILMTTMMMMIIIIYVLVPSNRKVLQIILIGISIMHEEFVCSRDRKTI